MKGRQVVGKLRKAGFEVVNIRGSEHTLRHPDGRMTTVPVHGSKDLRRGTLAAIRKQTGEDL
jgi:predicted RNA binding protein YcfA (HicA-like mRNA interferase family)